jgi:hypothetical protein
MPSLSLHTEYTLLSRAIAIAALSTSLLLSGCGSDNPTTRVSDSSTGTGGSSNIKTTYNLSVYSPTPLKNVRFRVIDAASNTELGNQVVSNGHQVIFAIPRAYTNAGTILVTELTPLNSTSTYYDAALDADAPLTETLHSAVSMTNGDRSLSINPFSEAAYQRALVRSGNLDPSTPLLSSLTEQDVRDANLETQAVFRVRPTEHGYIYDSRPDLAKLSIGTSNSQRFTDVMFGVIHVLAYYKSHPTETAPYLGFMKHIAADMRDGDLDGLTIMGLGDHDGIYLNDPLVTPILNMNPNRNTASLLAQDQFTVKTTYSTAQGQIAAEVLAPLFLGSSQEHMLLSNMEYFTSSNGVLIGLHSVGAGNYTRAYGLETGKTLQSFINSDDNRLISATEQLIGHYTGTGCALDIYPSGRIRLTQGTRTFESTINRELSDSISRDSATSNNYLLNVVTTSDSLPSFIQIRSLGNKVISATAGRSPEVNPNVLQQTDATCAF